MDGVVIVGEGVDKAAATAKRKAARVAQKKRGQARPGDKASGLDAGLAALMGGEADSTKVRVIKYFSLYSVYVQCEDVAILTS